eukprot:2769225-Amphidinium_carterae.1
MIWGAISLESPTLLQSFCKERRPLQGQFQEHPLTQWVLSLHSSHTGQLTNLDVNHATGVRNRDQETSTNKKDQLQKDQLTAGVFIEGRRLQSKEGTEVEKQDHKECDLACTQTSM